MKSLSHVRLSATPWTAAYQAPPSMGFSRQEYWSGVPLEKPKILKWAKKNESEAKSVVTLEKTEKRIELVYLVKVKVKSLSRVRLLVTPWTAAYQSPPSMGFSRREYWSGVPLPSPIYIYNGLFFSYKNF